MKEIKAIIQPHMLTKVMKALHALPHFPGATVSDCMGHGRGKGVAGKFETTVESIYPNRKAKLEVLCSDDQCNALVSAIQSAAHTGNPGDGIIIVVDLDRVVRIRTGEQQDAAI
jgi:nitrogen regulatory protein P-II 1